MRVIISFSKDGNVEKEEFKVTDFEYALDTLKTFYKSLKEGEILEVHICKG